MYFLKLSPTFLSCFPFTIPNKRSPYPAKRMQCYIRLLRLGRPKSSYFVAKTNHGIRISVNCPDIFITNHFNNDHFARIYSPIEILKGYNLKFDTHGMRLECTLNTTYPNCYVLKRRPHA